MSRRLLMTVMTMSLSLVALSAGAAELKSGLPEGAVPPAFHVTDVTGPAAGESLCYRCRYSSRPVVSVFTRNVDDRVVRLIKKLDTTVGMNQDQQLAAFVVLLTDDPDTAESQLAAAAKDNRIVRTPLTVYDGIVGPSSYNLARDADVTVMMWVEDKVIVNHAFSKGRLSDDAIARVIRDTSRILD